MTTVQGAFGDVEAPVPLTADSIPAGCYWWTDPEGGLCLLPGCTARVQDPEAECTCDTLAARLARAQRKLREHLERAQHAAVWWSALREAVEAAANGREIVNDARRRAGR